MVTAGRVAVLPYSVKPTAGTNCWSGLPSVTVNLCVERHRSCILRFCWFLCGVRRMMVTWWQHWTMDDQFSFPERDRCFCIWHHVHTGCTTHPPSCPDYAVAKSGRRKNPPPPCAYKAQGGGGGGVKAPLFLDLGARWGGLECLKLYIHSPIRVPEG